MNEFDKSPLIFILTDSLNVSTMDSWQPNFANTLYKNDHLSQTPPQRLNLMDFSISCFVRCLIMCSVLQILSSVCLCQALSLCDLNGQVLVDNFLFFWRVWMWTIYSPHLIHQWDDNCHNLIFLFRPLVWQKWLHSSMRIEFPFSVAPN